MNRTPLYDAHQAAGALFTDFHGWEMPIRYGSIPEEHAQVRERAGLFDLCHMGRLEVTGPGALDWLQRILTNDCATLKVGRARYTLILNDSGCTIDDALIYRLPESYLLVVNASNREAVVDWMTAAEHRGDGDATLHDRTMEWAMIAIQGPDSVRLVPQVVDNLEGAWDSMKYFSIAGCTVAGAAAWVARTGYTGEDGFEVYLPTEGAASLWQRLCEVGGDQVGLIGLGARDTLRLEAGMPLYGHELDLTTDPFEAGLGFAVKLDKTPHFLGHDALLKRQSPVRYLRGFRIDGRRVARQGMSIVLGEHVVGTITSGAPSPTLGYPIAMGYLKSDVPEEEWGELQVDVRGRREKLVVEEMPFFSRKREKGAR